MNCEQEEVGDHIDGDTGQGPALGEAGQGGVIQGGGQGGDKQRHQGNRNLLLVLSVRLDCIRVTSSKANTEPSSWGGNSEDREER